MSVVTTRPEPRIAPRRKVVHAVFPVAGFGARFLPATKACPKEMLPIVDRPLIQYAVEEAAAAGLTRMIFVTGRWKRAIEDHFDRAYELEHRLASRENDAALRALRGAVPAGVTFSYVRQRDVTGLPDALRSARPFVGDAPFAVVLPDDLIDSERPALAQLLEVFGEHQTSVVGVQRAQRSDDHEGFIAADLDVSAHAAARALVKVPPIGAASHAVETCGRYVFTPDLWEVLDDAHDRTLAQTIRGLMGRARVFACLIDGRRFDCGSKLGFLEAQFAFAQKRDDLWPGLRRTLDDLLGDASLPPREHPLPAALVSNVKAAAIR